MEAHNPQIAPRICSKAWCNRQIPANCRWKQCDHCRERDRATQRQRTQRLKEQAERNNTTTGDSSKRGKRNEESSSSEDEEDSRPSRRARLDGGGGGPSFLDDQDDELDMTEEVLRNQPYLT